MGITHHMRTCTNDNPHSVKHFKRKSIWNQHLTTQLWEEGYMTNIIPVKMGEYMKPGNKTLIMTSSNRGGHKARWSHRCGIRGLLHITHWYKVLPEEPCSFE